MEKTGSNDKSQPQRLLEEIDSTIQHTESEQYPTDPPEVVDAPKFPTIAEQQKYWDDKEKATEPTPPRKWSLARRKAYNAKKAKGWVPVAPPPQEEPVQMVRFCPCCGRNIERFLA